MSHLTALTNDAEAIAERLAHVHDQVNHHRTAHRAAWDERAKLASELHRVRAYSCSRMARELGVGERTVWSWLTKVEKE